MEEREKEEEKNDREKTNKTLVNKEVKKGWREGRGVGKKEESRYYITYVYKFPVMNVIFMYLELYQ